MVYSFSSFSPPLFFSFSYSFGQASHPLHLSLAYEGRPRSGSEPAPPRISHHPHPNHIHSVGLHHSHIPRDIDPSLFSNDFKVDIQDVLQQELQYGGDFSLSTATDNNTYTILNPHIHPHPHNPFYPPSHDPTLTSVALDSSPHQVRRQINPSW